MSTFAIFMILCSSFTSLQVLSFKYSNNNNSPGYYWSNGFRTYSQSQPQQQATQVDQTKESEEDPEYMYELLFGHQIRDIEKYKRQQGCLCNNRFRDPHCGTDYKVYDNGCYFECAQKRNPGLKLLNWGKC